MGCTIIRPFCIYPGAERTYGLDWRDNLVDGDTLASVTWDVPTGLNKISEGPNSVAVTEDGETYPPGTLALVRVAYVDAGTHVCRCSIVTAQGDRDSREVTFVAK